MRILSLLVSTSAVIREGGGVQVHRITGKDVSKLTQELTQVVDKDLEKDRKNNDTMSDVKRVKTALASFIRDANNKQAIRTFLKDADSASSSLQKAVAENRVKTQLEVWMKSKFAKKNDSLKMDLPEREGRDYYYLVFVLN
jgi:hypothetical protein